MAGIRGFTGGLGAVLGTPDPVELGLFYQGLVGGDLDLRDGTFVTLKPEDRGGFYLAFQEEPEHTPPAWPPNGPDDQQMQVHLDVGVGSVYDAVEDAAALGARLAVFQPQDEVRVMLDPAGHPFCLYLDR